MACNKKVLFLYILLLLILCSCSLLESGGPKELDPKVYYTRDLVLKVDGNKKKGVGVLPDKDLYKIKVISEGRMDLLVIETCHREITVEKAGFREGYLFKRMHKEENRSDCSFIRFSSFEHNKGRHGYGFLVIQHKKYKLNASLRCNGRFTLESGTSICQAKRGLYQTIEFQEPVKIFMSKCKIEVPEVSKSFRFQIPARSCRLTFQNEKGERHLLYTEGYEKIIRRE